MILAHVDCSGTMGDSPAFVMAGYIARADAWETFSEEWQAVLDWPDPRPLRYFKMSEAFARRDQFNGFDIEQRDFRLRKFVPIVNRHALASIMVVIPTASWKHYFVGRLEKDYDRPYQFAFHGIMRMLITYLDMAGIPDKIDYVFDDEGGEPTERILAVFKRWLEKDPLKMAHRIGSLPIFRRDELVLPLQAADMLAWHIRRARDPRKNHESIPTVIADEIFGGVKQRLGKVFTDAEIRGVFEFLNE